MRITRVVPEVGCIVKWHVTYTVTYIALDTLICQPKIWGGNILKAKIFATLTVAELG